ncbi:Homeodomain 1 [Mycena indigotica]|uniref:Homeodomain 1 n=1 Tax=Mycena indigotica TaxID=2126181 RepID=A0A8H6W9X4_9AGAR|nr:Homeodomain 1 [Mycena indigotica]KAF7307083.1 Homeodomain 1 [Mycena indigotica]
MSLLERVAEVETVLADAATAGTIEKFQLLLDKWTALEADIDNLAAPDPAVIDAARVVASEIAIFTKSLLAAREEQDAHLAAFMELADPDRDAPVIRKEAKPTRRASPKPSPIPSTIKTKDSLQPAYIEPAYKWLLKHLYSPYPSQSVKESLASESSCAVSRITDWFSSMRRRIGWTALLRSEFGRRRADMLAAAARYFHPASTQPLAPGLQGRFAEIELNAREVYGERFIPSALSNKIAAAVKDMTPDLREQARSLPVSDVGASTSSPSRKRRLSESALSPPLKKPRQRQVSDPTPTASSPADIFALSGDPADLAAWFADPGPALDLFDPNVVLDIHAFDPAAFLELDTPPPLTPLGLPQTTLTLSAAAAGPVPPLDLSMMEVLGIDCSLDALGLPLADPLVYQPDDFVGHGFGDPNYFDSYIPFAFPLDASVQCIT